jgi:hypothetical protein
MGEENSYTETALRELREEAEREAVNKAKSIIRDIALHQENISKETQTLSTLQQDLKKVSPKTYIL